MAELENCDLNDELKNTHENFEFETHELSIGSNRHLHLIYTSPTAQEIITR